MKKSTSLKEFSTTPTVSYMLSKDGNNIAGQPQTQQQQAARTANQPAQVPREKPPQQQADDADDAMYEME